MAVRMKDIAADLGISAMAVSKALRDHKDISEETRARVRERAAELNYRVNQVARSMATGRTYLVGLIVPDLMQSFFAEIATALSAAIAPAGYHLLISHSNEDAAAEAEDIDILVSRKVDGLVIATAQGDTRKLKAIKTPYVLIDRAIPGLNANFVGSCDVEIGRIATEHLLARGCRRIAHLAGPPSSAGRGRIEGYRAVMVDHPALEIIDAGHDDVSGHRAMTLLLERTPRPDGVFCFNDPVAVGAMRAAFEAGVRVPQDIAIVGAANMRHSDMLRIPLSTIDQDTAAIGAAAGRLLLELIGAKKPPRARRIETPITLVARESSARDGG